MKERDELLSCIEVTFRPLDRSKSFRQFPTWGTGLEGADNFFNMDPMNYSVSELDRHFDLWLCVSFEAFRHLTKFVLIACLVDRTKAEESAIIDSYLDSAADEKIDWFAEFSRDELRISRRVLEFLSRGDGSDASFRRILHRLETV